MRMRFPFGKKTKAAAPESPEGIPMDGPTPADMPAPKPSKPPKTRKKVGFSFGAKRARFDDGEVQVGIELENGRRLYFVASQDGAFQRLDEDRDVSAPVVVTAYRNDWRVFAPAALTDAKAKGYSARETDALERMAVINESRKGRLYTTPMGGLEPGEMRVPLFQVLDEMVGDRRGEFVAGVLLGDQDLAIMYAYKEGVMGPNRVLVSVNPENLEAVASSFVSMAGMPDDAEVVLFDQAEFMQRLMTRSWTPYPATQGFYGIPKTALPALMVGVTGVAAIAGVGHGGYWYLQEVGLKKQLSDYTQKHASLVVQVSDEILTKHTAFVEKTSVNVLRATDIASLLRNEGGKVEATMTRSSFDYSIFTQFFAPDEAGNDGVFRGAISHQPIEGCTKTAIETTGGMREIKTQFSCPTLGPNLARFGW